MSTASKTYTISHTDTLFVFHCSECGILMGVADDWMDDARRDGRRIHCPNGHWMSYRRTEADKLRAQLEDVRAQRDHARAATQRERKMHSATKGQLTKARKRAANGVCPDQACHRSFTDLATHVRTCHPELVEALQ